jgi:hypothetical protein
MSNIRNNKVSVLAYDSSAALEIPPVHIDLDDRDRFADVSYLIYKSNARLFATLTGRLPDEKPNVSDAATTKMTANYQRQSIPSKRDAQNEAQSAVCTIL